MATPNLRVIASRTDVIPSVEADAMSRIWQVVATVETLQADMKRELRHSNERTKSLDALAIAATNLAFAAVALLPASVAQQLTSMVAAS